MDTGRIDKALINATDTHSVVIGAGVISQVLDVFTHSFGEQSPILIADENTYAVAGKFVQERFTLAGKNKYQPYIFPGTPTLYANDKNVSLLENVLRNVDAVPVVVGSGTLNDLTKVAAHHCGRKYMTVATAASMDGYTAFGAAITLDGFKQTVSCPAPYAVLADLDIILKAPALMTSSGYADLLGKITAGADWLIADTLGIEAVDRAVWSLVQDSLRDWTAAPKLLHSGDVRTMGYLVEGLILTGLAMQAYQSSRPASGSEHQFSHLWEMHEKTHGAVSHGFKVGIGSIASAALYEQVLAQDITALDIAGICNRWLTREQLEQTVRRTHHNPVLVENAVEKSLEKYVSVEVLRDRLMVLKGGWSILREKLKSQLMTAAELRYMLNDAGAPTQSEQIGVSREQLKSNYFQARQIRSRYTIFDLAAETGCFESCVENMFARGGFWH